MKNKNIYLVAKYIGRPRDPKRTSQRGYINNPENMIYDEQVHIVRGLRNKDIDNQVILDLTDEKIIKNSFKSDTTFEDLFSYYHEGYSEQINASVNAINGE